MKDHKKEKPFIPEQTEKETKRGGRKLITQTQTLAQTQLTVTLLSERQWVTRYIRSSALVNVSLDWLLQTIWQYVNYLILNTHTHTFFFLTWNLLYEECLIIITFNCNLQVFRHYCPVFTFGIGLIPKDSDGLQVTDTNILCQIITEKIFEMALKQTNIAHRSSSVRRINKGEASQVTKVTAPLSR